MMFLFMGIKISQRYKSRQEAFSQLVILIDNISNEIRYYIKPLSAVINEISRNELCPQLSFLNEYSVNSNNQTDFPVEWEKAVMNSDIPFSFAEKKKIASLAMSLGHSDKDIQINILKSYREHFVCEAGKAEKLSEKYAVTITVTFSLIGGAVFLLII